MVNTYNIYNDSCPSCIYYHAVAESEDEVRELAKVNNTNIDGLTIELIRKNVRDELGRPMPKAFHDVLVF